MNSKFKKLEQAEVVAHVAGTSLFIGEVVTICSVVNTGTKRNPTYRYSVAGAWLDEDALGPVTK